MVERRFAWLSSDRRMDKDQEGLWPQSADQRDPHWYRHDSATGVSPRACAVL